MHVLWFLSAASKPSVWRVVFLSHFPCCSYWEKIWEWPSQSSPDHSPTLPKITHLKSITNSKSPSPSLLSRHSPVCTLSHQNWADYLSLSLQKAWMLKTHYMVFCGRGRSLKCSWGGQQAPQKGLRNSALHLELAAPTTHIVLRPQYLSFVFPSRMTSHEPDSPVYYSFFFS